ncbi:CPBP family intramembrane glutamic endopeptidase [Streptococcus respiraculi]|uniref:CPBP family intramembrane glutamic endopeptidase n=1 Tax=Streptococcus respiraculi TaxID=2021971 RepID=UPI000E73563B|nr:type II CAAX endopeptidase family protein [Streptococcus respiraculi]
MFFEKTMSFFAGTLGAFIINILCWQLNQGDFHQHELFYIVANILICALLFYAILKDKIATLRLPSWLELGLAAVVFVGMFLFMALYLPLVHSQSGASSEIHAITATGISLSFFLEASLFGPLREEIFIRGFLQKGVFNHNWWGLLLSSAFFSILHAPLNVAAFVYYAVMGLAYGWAYKKSDNLLIPILLHITWNGLWTLIDLFQ